MSTHEQEGPTYVRSCELCARVGERRGLGGGGRVAKHRIWLSMLMAVGAGFNDGGGGTRGEEGQHMTERPVAGSRSRVLVRVQTRGGYGIPPYF